ncbi:MAG: LPS export ABC transporter periplasmic protein LptC [Lautropia sp.]|nr:LPS export ABC transporter periplasmic protein LptC [Lautropia sp.]
MSPRLFDRLAGTASVLILIALGMSSYYFAKKAEQGQAAPPVAGRPDPDYFVDRMTLMRADATGAPSVRVEAERMLHYPLEQRVEFANPLIISLDERQPLMTVRARRGSALDTGDIAELYDEVQIRRAASGRDPELLLDTSTATIDMARRLIFSDAPVQMQAGDNRLDGIGMVVDEHTRQLRLKRRVQGHFPATPATAAKPSAPAAPLTDTPKKADDARASG